MEGYWNMTKTIIQTDKLCKSFRIGSQEQQVIKNLDIEIYDKDFTVIMGASGAGKSTLLRLVWYGPAIERQYPLF